tara:strand:- start:71 stop:778 length:708 start_codon:yes stop_codon:yes gene_type:complete
MQKVKIGDCTLYQGDCLEIMPTLDKVDAVVTDPPYGIGERKGTISKKRDKNNYYSVDDTEDNILKVVIPAIKIALEKSTRAIITPGGKCAWHYPKPTDIGIFYQPAAMGMTHWGRTTSQPVLFYGKDPMSGKTIKPLHWIVTEAPEKNGHPCPKPIRIWTKVVDRASMTGETVLDPFMGSGTTGVACAKLGRKFIGIELEPKYFDIACERIQKAYDQPDMFVEPPKKATQEKLDI